MAKVKARIRKSLDELTNFFGGSLPGKEIEPTVVKEKEVKELFHPREEPKEEEPLKEEEESNEKKGKPETLNSVRKKVEKIVADHMATLPPPSRMVSAKEIKAWILEHPGQNVNSTEFLNWVRSPDGQNPNPYLGHFAELLQKLEIEHQVEVEVKGYVYDFYIPNMNLYIDIDPISLDTDDPKAKLSITVDKAKVDIIAIWRGINESREARCKPYRFLAIKERLYKESVNEFIKEYLDWYYQKMIHNI